MVDSKATVLVYKTTWSGSDLIFVPEERALFVDQVWRAIGNSATFGEFRRNLPAGEWEKIVERERESSADSDEGFEIPKDDDAFNYTWSVLLEETSYPGWLQQEMLTWFPLDIAWRFGGKMDTSLTSGECLVIPQSAEKKIVDALKERGFSVTRRDELMLDGYAA